MVFQEIIYTKENGIASVTLNRPEVLNVLNPDMVRELIQAIQDVPAGKPEDPRVVGRAGTKR